MFFSRPSYLAFKHDCNWMHFAPLMLCYLFARSMEKDIVSTIKHPLCFACFVLLCFLCFHALLSFLLFLQEVWNIIRKTPQRREPPPPPSRMSIWKSLPSLFVCNASHGLFKEYMCEHMSQLFDVLVLTMTILFVDRIPLIQIAVVMMLSREAAGPACSLSCDIVTVCDV